MEMTSYLTPQVPLINHSCDYLIRYVCNVTSLISERVLGGSLRWIYKSKYPHFTTRVFVTAISHLCDFVAVLGGKTIVSQSRDLTLKECYQYLFMEYGIL